MSDVVVSCVVNYGGGSSGWGCGGGRGFGCGGSGGFGEGDGDGVGGGKGESGYCYRGSAIDKSENHA